MTAIPKISALFESSLASALSAAGTSFTLVSGTDRDGNALSGLYGFIIDEGSADEEFCVGTISGTTVTISKRGCDADDPETEVSANKKAHRRGASVKITDYPILAYLRNVIAGESGYTLPALLRQASSVGNPVNADDLARKGYVDSVVAGIATTVNVIVPGTAGETVAAGNLIYFDDTDNEWKKCDADTASTVENTLLGIAQGAGVDGGAISSGVLLRGLDSNQSGLAAGAIYYASNTAGGISSSPGTKEVTLGFSYSTTQLYFNPRFNQQITEDEQDALAGTSGTPSSSNKFVTNDDVASAATANKIARRNATGDITVPSTPSASTDAASKSYVDSLFPSRKIAVQTAQLTLNSSSTETDIIANTSVAGGSLSSGRAIHFKAYIGLTQQNTSGTTTFRIYFGGSAVGTFSSSGVGGILHNGFVEATIAYVGASSQYISGVLMAVPQNTGSNASTTMVSLSTTSAVNEANAQNVKMTVQGSAANTPTTIVVYGATISLI